MKRITLTALLALLLSPAAALAQTGPYSPQPVADITQNGAINNVGASVMLPLSGQSTCSIAVSGTWSGALQPTGESNDGVTEFPLQVTPYGGGTPSTSITGNGLYIGACTALSEFSVVATSWTSGSAVIALRGAYQNTSAGSSSTVTITGSPSVTVANFPATQTIGGAGSAGAPAANVVSVQGIGGGTNLPVNCASGCGSTAWTYYNIPASATCVSAVCVIKASGGTLHSIIGLTAGEPHRPVRAFGTTMPVSRVARFSTRNQGLAQVKS